jgi:hypothetical protein
MNRIGRRIFMCILLTAALAVIWNLFGHERGSQLRRSHRAAIKIT